MHLLSKIPQNLFENTQIQPVKTLDEYDTLSENLDATLDQEITIPSDVLNSFKIKDDLNQDIWPEGKLDEQVKAKLIKIAKSFMKDTKLPKGTKIKDFIFTGSLANYNWSKFSDVDLHIILNFDQFNETPEFVKEFFDSKKNLWNLEHDIEIKGFPVELYAQDTKEHLEATAVYSLIHDKWIRKPTRENFTLNKKGIKAKAEKFIQQLKDIRDAFKNENYQGVLDASTKLKDKIKKMRKAGLERGGEYSLENLVFKVLRRTTFMDLLSDLKAKAYDKLMSLSEQDMNEGHLLDNATFKVEKVNDDDYYITAEYNGDEIGILIMYEVTNGYWMFDGDLTEEEYSKIFPDDEFIDLNYLDIKDKVMRGEGIAKKLVSLAIEQAKKLGYSTMYLNASPMGPDGLNISDLVGFYESFGFNVFKHQGGNAMMVLYLKKDLNETSNESQELAGSVLFIQGEKLEDGTHRLYVTTIKNAMKLDRKKADNTDGQPALMATFGNNEVFRVGYHDGNFKAMKTAWNTEASMLQKMGLQKTSVVLNDKTGKTPAHQLSRRFNNVQQAVNALRPVLLSLPNIRWEK